MLTLLINTVLSNLLYFVLHIDNSSSFPRPLSAAKERECLEKIRNGDKEAKKVLIEHNLRLVAHIIKKYYSQYSEQEDLISIGTIGLIKAIETFDINKGTRMATYASRCIENEVLMYFRAQRRTSMETSMSEPIDTDGEGNPLTFIDILCSDDNVDDIIDSKIKCEKLVRYLDRLEGREREIINLRYGLNNSKPLTQREVAEKFGISRSYVSRLEKKAILQLRRDFDS